MNTINAYRLVEKILTKYYDEGAPDDVGAFLGDMSSEIWEQTDENKINSGDPAFFEDWTDAWDKIVGKDKEATSQQIFEVAKVLLDYYANDVEYDLGDAEGYLKKGLES
jgi:hypothetical protein